jgi:hypothetical protein
MPRGEGREGSCGGRALCGHLGLSAEEVAVWALEVDGVVKGGARHSKMYVLLSLGSGGAGAAGEQSKCSMRLNGRELKR